VIVGSDDEPAGGISGTDPSEVLPSLTDQGIQRSDLVRLLATAASFTRMCDIPCLMPLASWKLAVSCDEVLQAYFARTLVPLVPHVVNLQCTSRYVALKSFDLRSRLRHTA